MAVAVTIPLWRHTRHSFHFSAGPLAAPASGDRQHITAIRLLPPQYHLVSRATADSFAARSPPAFCSWGRLIINNFTDIIIHVIEKAERVKLRAWEKSGQQGRFGIDLSKKQIIINRFSHKIILNDFNL